MFLQTHQYQWSRLEVTLLVSSLQSSIPLWTLICDCIWLQLDRPNAELLGGLTCQVSKNRMQNDRWWQINLAIEKTEGFPGPVLQESLEGPRVWEDGKIEGSSRQQTLPEPPVQKRAFQTLKVVCYGR